MGKAFWRSWIAQTGLVAAVYYLAGYLSLFLALPPGYASPVWPATGLSIAALLIFGLNRFPGVFIGALLVNLRTPLGFVESFPPLIIASGTTLSVIVAATLIKRWVSYPRSFYREKDIFLFLFIAGPLAAVISATIGSFTLYKFDLVHAQHFSLNWIYWFIGDATGNILFSPLALIFAVPSRNYWIRSTKTILVPLLLLLSLIVLALNYVGHTERDKIIQEFHRRSELVSNLFEKDLQAYQSMMVTLKSFYESSETVTEKEFRDFTESYYINYPEVLTVGWISVINSSNYPLVFAEPKDKNLQLLGQNFATLPLKQLVDTAMTGPHIIVANSADLEGLKVPGSSLIFALFGQGGKGVLLEIIDLDKVIANLNKYINDSSYRFILSNVTERDNHKVLADTWHPLSVNNEVPFNSQLQRSYVIKVANQKWQLSIFQDPSLSHGISINTSILLFTTLFFTYLICSLLLVIANRILSIEDAVKEKTTHLNEVNRQLQKASQAKSEFLANMSHEIRTPLNVLVGMTDLLEDTKIDAEQKHYIDIAKKAGNNLLSIINDILDISKIEAGLISLEKTEIDLPELISDLSAMFKLKAQEKGLELKVEVASEVNNIYEGDPTRIRQILTNLLSNALKFTSKGEITLTVTGNDNIHRPGNILFQVMDTGIGVPQDKLAQLFQPFTQADSTITRKFGGTGLGLSICKRLTQMMNGDIQVDSTEGQGSTFSFTLTLTHIRPIESSLPSYAVEVPTVQPATDFSLKILIVDDVEDNRVLLKAYLKNSSHEIYEAENGIQALQLAKENTFDIILMDMQMPIMDGFTATQEIRRWEKLHEKPPVNIWALTAYALKNEIQKSMEAGCDLHLIKPIRRNDLINHINNFVQAQQKNP
ncbi:ATP-binding protein [Bdellovibrio bacteriovorus]